MILNHIKAYYHGVKDLKCPILRAELGYKIQTFKQRMNKLKDHSKINSLGQDTSDDDDDDGENALRIPFDDHRLSKLKRRRNSDDEKENEQPYRKVIIKSSNVNNEQRMVIIKKLVNNSDSKQSEIIEEKFRSWILWYYVW